MSTVDYREMTKPELVRLVRLLLRIVRKVMVSREKDRFDRTYPGWETWR